MKKLELICYENSNKYAYIKHCTADIINKYCLVYDSLYKCNILGIITDVDSYKVVKVLDENTKGVISCIIFYIEDILFLLDKDEEIGYLI